MPDPFNPTIGRRFNGTLNDDAPNDLWGTNDGIADPIRRTLEPTQRLPRHRLWATAPLYPDENLDWDGQREFHTVRADQPLGVLDPMEEYRLLGDGRHA